RPVELGGPRIRTLLAVLTANAGRVTGVGALASALWGAASPPHAHRTVLTYLSRLRRALLPAATALGGRELLETHPAGYALRLPAHLVDTQRFERLVVEGRAALAGSRPEIAAESLSLALALWRGEAYEEFAGVPALRSEATRLRELRLSAMADRVDAELATGAGGTLIDELTGLTELYPGHDRWWAQLMVALYRAGRQADASTVFGRARAVLVERFGLDPSPRLVETHRQVLDNDVRLMHQGTR
ncbi:BTAD domain-containing putative transcriptional regulator, partial [Actinophytocola sp.]|uniref:AfsR/SARP family transcriptional regulator n=1 Tax=Actinophytocola sp. TaxID=1872138 RepID=UPI00389A36E0